MPTPQPHPNGSHPERPGTATILVSAPSLPAAIYGAMREVLARGYRIRTQYDRKTAQGGYIDPPSLDVSSAIEILDPYAQPRYPKSSCVEIGKYIDYYPTGSALCYKEFNEGTRWIITTAVGYETNQRIMGAMPAKMTRNFFKNLTWISDANFICIPKGLDEARRNVSLKLLAYLETREQQAFTYDDGFMYPGPAVKDVPLSMAPKESQDKLNAVITLDLTNAIKNYPTVGPLASKELVEAFDMWDRLVGSAKK